MAVPPSTERATEKPCAASAFPPVPTSLTPFCVKSASAGRAGGSSAIASTAGTMSLVPREAKRERAAAPTFGDVCADAIAGLRARAGKTTKLDFSQAVMAPSISTSDSTRRLQPILDPIVPASVRVKRRDQPRVGGRGAGRAAARERRRAVEQPQHDLPIHPIPPEDVADPVAVEVSGFIEEPLVRRCRTGRAARREYRRAVEQPEHDLPGRGVVPDDVAEAVAVEIAGADDEPGARRRTGRAAGGQYRRAVHEPEHNLPRRGIVPEDVAHP